MKTIGIARAATLATRGTSDAYALTIIRPDGQTFGFTSADHDETIDGVVHRSSPGLQVSEIQQTSSLAVDTMSLSTLNDGTIFTKDDILADVWKNSTFVLSKYDWQGLSDGVEPVLSGVLGQPQVKRTMLIVELRDIKQYHQQTLGAPSSKTCRNRFATFDGFSTWCQLEASDFTFTGEVVAVTDSGQFTANLVQAVDYFGNGVLTWDGGENAGLQAVVKDYDVSTDGGEFTLDLPMFKGIQVGDTFSVIAGCRKRREEDCAAKFDNVVDFNGEPDRPTPNEVLQAPTPSV